MLLVEQVVHADAHAVDLVGVGRADAAAGRADLLLAGEPFGDLVDRAVVRRDDVRGFAHEQARAIDATAFEPVDLLKQHFGVHHNAVADDRRGPRADDAGRQQVQRIRFVAHDHGVSCIVAAVEPGNVIHLGADQISGFAFAFVAPLGADQYDSRHVCSSGSPYSRRGKVTPRPARLARGGGARGAKPRYLSARPADPSCSHASTTRAAIESSASRPHERGSYIFLLPTSPSTLSTSS